MPPFQRVLGRLAYETRQGQKERAACWLAGPRERKGTPIHAVVKLVGLAKLEGARKAAMDADPDLLANWALAQDWSEEKRYHRIDRAEAEALSTAITDDAHGVFPWIKAQW